MGFAPLCEDGTVTTLAQHSDSDGPIVSNKSDLSTFDFLSWFK